MSEHFMHRNRLLLPLSLFLVTIISRIPFTSKLLYHIDSVNFALALKNYDLMVHQPHPPGYFLYVMLGRLLNLFIEDANTVFVSISILFSGLAIVVIYYLGREIYSEKIGIVSALIAMTSPTFWFHGGIALTYIVEAFFSTLIALLCWRILKGEHKYIWLSVIALGLAGGIRQNTTVFLFPLWLYSVRTLPVKKIVLSLGLLGLVCLSWFVPMVWMTGGWNAYREAFRELWAYATGHNSVFEKGWLMFKVFSSALLLFVALGLGVWLFPAGLMFYTFFRNRLFLCSDKTKMFFFLFWLLPPILFYLLIFIHPANPGYALIFLPALFILSAISIENIAAKFKIIRIGVSQWCSFVLVTINIFVFFFLKLPTSYTEIKDHDRDLAIITETLKSNASRNTLLFSRDNVYCGFRHIMYYLPDYRVYFVSSRKGPAGETRDIFEGTNWETTRSRSISVPERNGDFAVLIISDDGKKPREINGFPFKQPLPDTYIAFGPIETIKKIYPDLNIQVSGKGKS